jgi:hypothetical protein
MPVILATQEAEIRRTAVQRHPEQIVLQDPFTKIGLVEWLKMKALSSGTSTAKERERESQLMWQSLSS